MSELLNEPVDVHCVVVHGEVVGLWVVVKIVDVVVEVARWVLRVGVQYHAAVRTLEHHVTEGN